MSRQETTGKKGMRGMFFILTGICLLAAAVALVLYNKWDSDRAGKVSEEILTKLDQVIMENVGDEQIAASVRDAFIVKEEYLMSALEEITRAYGSVMQYILQGLEIPKEVTDGFRGKMLK